MLIVTIPHVLVADVDFKGRDIDRPVVAFKCDCLRCLSGAHMLVALWLFGFTIVLVFVIVSARRVPQAHNLTTYIRIMSP